MKVEELKRKVNDYRTTLAEIKARREEIEAEAKKQRQTRS